MLSEREISRVWEACGKENLERRGELSVRGAMVGRMRDRDRLAAWRHGGVRRSRSSEFAMGDGGERWSSGVGERGIAE